MICELFPACIAPLVQFGSEMTAPLCDVAALVNGEPAGNVVSAAGMRDAVWAKLSVLVNWIVLPTGTVVTGGVMPPL